MLNIDLVRSVGSLSLVLVVLFSLAWLLKRTKIKKLNSRTVARIVGGVALGARERVVVVEIANRWIVVGVSSGRMSALANLEAVTPDSAISVEISELQTPPSQNTDPKGSSKDFSTLVQKVVNQ